MTDVRLSRFLGFFSIGLGVAEIAGAGPMSRVLGLWGQRSLVRAFGAREIATGLYLLGRDDEANAMWARVAGDTLDIGLLSAAALRRNRRSENAVAALLMVGAVTAVDVGVALSLTRRDASALATARRTRINRPTRAITADASPRSTDRVRSMGVAPAQA